MKVGDHIIETGYSFGNGSGVIIEIQPVVPVEGHSNGGDVLLLYADGGLGWTDSEHLVPFDADLAVLMGIGTESYGLRYG
jgi:hypothetical protein